ncbi:MAG: class I SAM-dependent methyltransferase [Arcobacter sp.]|nr:class I SAM-dependent methyltransferase [Arcobacter sp.]
MEQFGNLYSKYYDLMYEDKDYNNEVEYVDNLIKAINSDAVTLLDLGCGTGKHAELFCEKGYKVHGVDLSREMLQIAEKRKKGKEQLLDFSNSDIRELELKREFDVVVSLFHVISYQNSNEDLIKVFKGIKQHLKNEGIFIFDFWYGPAVLTDLPTKRIKRLENESIKVTRIAEPTLYAHKNVVDVNYDIFIENKYTKEIIEKKELHKMRYYFDTELELICSKFGFKIEKKYEWLREEEPDFRSWNVVWVLKK